MKAEYTKLYKQLVKVMGPEEAKVELQRVIDTTDFDDHEMLLDFSFVWEDSPQGHYYWAKFAEKLRQEA